MKDKLPKDNNKSNIENNKENGIIFEEPEINDLLNKIIEKNIEKIEWYSNVLKSSELISLFSFLIFLIILCLKLSPIGNFSWLYLNIPGIISLIGIIIILNCFFIIKDLIDKSENPNNTSIQKGSLISLIVTNIIIFSFSIFLFLITLRLNESITNKKDLNLIFIPFYISLIALFLFGIFIFPSFIYNGLYFEIGLIFTYIICGFISSSLLCSKVNNINGLNHNNKLKYFHCFIPFYFSISTNIFYYILNMIFDNTKNNTYSNLVYIFGLLFIFISGLITQLKEDNIINNKNNYFQVILLIVSLILFSFDIIINLIFDENEEREELE